MGQGRWIMGISFRTSPASDAKPPRRGSSPTFPRLQTRTWRSKAPAGPCTSAPAQASPWPCSRQWPSARAAPAYPFFWCSGCVATPRIICHSPARSWRVAFSYISSCRSGVSVHMPLTMATGRSAWSSRSPKSSPGRSPVWRGRAASGAASAAGKQAASRAVTAARSWRVAVLIFIKILPSDGRFFSV